ncbi:MAG TPA: zinc-binding dehydrogenase [Nitriliruptorales bacterium]|nr:zinc-binding dehydrogenase [Nitriliruptorales bacterium]
MFAITATSFSRDDPLSGLALGDHPDPDPPDGWELVRVRAASLNHHDIWTLRGVGVDEERLPIVLGCDAAGVTGDGREVVVHGVISGSDGGDETLASDASILSERHDGTFADLVAVPRRNLVDKPDELSFAEAASLPTAYLTAYRALFMRARLRPGDRLLVQGAGGGTATAAILLARAAGGRVFVTSRSADKRQQALDLGAHDVLEAGARLPERMDVVFESVGTATWEHTIRSTRDGGTVVVIGATTGTDPPAGLNHLFYRQLRVIGSTMGTRDELVSLVRFLRATGVRPLIDDTFPLREARRAFERMLAGDVFGKLVLTADE